MSIAMAVGMGIGRIAMSKPAARPFTGWHMLAMMVAFFGVVIAVNFTMARLAMTSFGGVVVENSYVASQNFNGWLQDARNSDALGWQVSPDLRDDGRLAITVAGAPDALTISATARHPLGRLPDKQLTFTRTAAGEYLSVEALAADRWILRLELSSGDQHWRSESEVQ